MFPPGSAPILDVDHPLGVGVAEVGAVRWPVVNLGTGEQRVKQGRDLSWAVHGDGDAHHVLVDGVRRLVREDAGGEAGDHLLHPRLVRRVQDVVVDVDVSPLGMERFVRSVGWGPPKPCTRWVITH